ncbi:VWA domain-containing protein [Lutimonas halocynthiae]|uniref:VWA domain-containing protein n=1 Tax=Lutimonas halocynthiae TaxID=1446477 RepID=UPI0025B378E4|nr:VWA domain-containing protein [Lutimonas halocynthiae]MDN3642032.1 VWA domain-containing protein [Lutimonas halocynthiae]
MPENFELAYKWVLFLLPLPFLVIWLLPPLRIKSAALLVPNLSKTEVISGVKSKKSALVKPRNRIVSVALFIIWALLLATLSSPRLVGEPELKIKTSRNFLIVADISFSMANNDWYLEGKRATRWQAVKSVMHEFISKRTGDRMGLIFFGSSAYIQAPFTSDLSTVDQLLDEADVGMAGQMTNIGKAIVKGIEMFDQDTIKTKVMLVLTDGVDSGTEILPLDAADMARKDSIHVYTLGIGNPENSGSDLDEKTLREIAELTEATYFRAIDTDNLEQVYTELDKLEPIEFEEESFTPVTLLYIYPLLGAIGLALVLSLILGSISLSRSVKTKSDL